MAQAGWHRERIDASWRGFASGLLLLLTATASCTLDSESRGGTRRHLDAALDEAQTVISHASDPPIVDAQDAHAHARDAQQPVDARSLDQPAPQVDLDASPGACVDEDARCSEPACKTAADCPLATALCHEAVCQDGRCGLHTLATGAACGAGGVCGERGDCRECDPPGRTMCIDAGSQRACDMTGHWSAAESCEHTCLGGACAQCTPGTAECLEGQRRACGDDGRWGVAQACASGCTGDRCNDCTPGQAECTANDSQVRSCNANAQWDAPVACASGCANSRCNQCTPGANRCTSDGAQSCGADQQWGAASACAAGCNGDLCAQCKTGARECPSATMLRVCSDNAWDTAQSCRPHSTCNATSKDGNSCPCDAGYDDPSPDPGLCTARKKK
jgi:hypothetical protein